MQRAVMRADYASYTRVAKDTPLAAIARAASGESESELARRTRVRAPRAAPHGADPLRIHDGDGQYASCTEGRTHSPLRQNSVAH